MQIMLKNEGSYPVKVITHGTPIGNPEDPSYDNGIKETMIEPNGFANLTADSVEHFTIREYTPTAPDIAPHDGA